MSKFRIVPHGRLQEWVAEEKGYFADEGLDYEFVPSNGPNSTMNPSVDSAEGAPTEIKRGAFESMESGRACEISSACHWAVGMAASAAHGRMWGHAYSVTPSAIWVAPESPQQYHAIFDPRKAGIGERMVFEPYTREMFDRTHRWMLDWQIFPENQVGRAAYEEAVLV